MYRFEIDCLWIQEPIQEPFKLKELKIIKIQFLNIKIQS